MNDRAWREAVRKRHDLIQRGLALVSTSIVLAAFDVSPGGATLQSRPAMATGSGRRRFGLRIHERLEPSESTLVAAGYRYAIDDADGREILAWHLHPRSFPGSHLHLGSVAGTMRNELTRAHIPTGVVAYAEFIRFLIRDFGVRPRRLDWESVLAALDRP